MNACCLLGLKEEALARMESGYKNGFAKRREYFYSYLYLKNNRLFDVLKNEPRFQELLRRAEEDYRHRSDILGAL